MKSNGSKKNKPPVGAGRATSDRAYPPIPMAELLVAAMSPTLAVRFLDIHYQPGKVSPAVRRKALRLRRRLERLVAAEFGGLLPDEV